MRKQVIYLPLEKYKSRYTAYLSGVDGAFFQQAMASNRCDVQVLAPDHKVREILHGVVVDYLQRSQWGFWQVERLLELIAAGKVDNDTVIFIEDMWLPGFEMIPYACHIKGIRPKVYAICYAQTFDTHDFTYPMRDWMRPIEMGYISWLTGLFVASEDLRQAVVNTAVDVYFDKKVHSVGLMFSRQRLLDIYPGVAVTTARSKRYKNVVFASRLDKEKNPDFFVQVARAYYKFDPSVTFTFAWASAQPYVDAALAKGRDINLKCQYCKTKQEYLELLAHSTVSFNCADQDYVSFTLLEALAYGMVPLYTNYKPSFVATLKNNSDFLYDHLIHSEAVNRLVNLLLDHQSNVMFVGDVPPLYTTYGAVYEKTVNRMLDIMFAEPTLAEELAK